MVPIGYASRETGTPSLLWYRVALCCVLLPLITGVLITGAYLLTWRTELQFAGFLCIVGGSFLAVLAIAAVVIPIRKNNASALRDTLVVLALIALDVLVCIGCIAVAIAEKHVLKVVAINNTTVPVTNLKIRLPDGDIVLRDLKAGQTTSRRVKVQEELAVTASADVGVTPVAFDVDGYFSGPQERTITFASPTTAPSVR